MTRLPEHSHCEYCGDPTPYGTYFCNEECMQKRKAEVRKSNLRDLAFYGTVGIALCVVVFAVLF